MFVYIKNRGNWKIKIFLLYNLPFRRDCGGPAKLDVDRCGCKCEKLLVTWDCCRVGCSGGATQTPSEWAADDEETLSITDEGCGCCWTINGEEGAFGGGTIANGKVSIGCARWGGNADCKNSTICLLLLGGSWRGG